MAEGLQELVQRLRSDEGARRELAGVLAPELQRELPASGWERAKPFLAGLSSAAVVLLAFLLPSLQEQWDRYRTRQAVDRYADIGRGLLAQEHFASAEQAYGRALELAGMQREDLLEGQLRARVLKVYETPEWRGKPDESVTEADFVYLLAAETAPEQAQARASTAGAYGVWLAGRKRWADAENRLKEAASLDPAAAGPHVHLGNLYDDLGRRQDAEREYRRALQLGPADANAHYDMALLLADTGRPREAADEFAQSVRLDPDDLAGRLALAEALEGLGQLPQALEQAEAALKLAPGNAEAVALARRLRGRVAHGHGRGGEPALRSGG